MNTESAAASENLENRGDNRSQRPSSSAFNDFVMSDWAARPGSDVSRSAVADFTAERRAALGELFPSVRLVIPAGGLKTRSNDTDYRFRPHSAFAHLTGLGSDREPDAVLVLDPIGEVAAEPAGTPAAVSTHTATLYFRPLAPRDTDEFFADSRYGEFWVGARPTLDDVATETGIATAHIDSLGDALAKDAGADGVQIAVISQADDAIATLVSLTRTAAGIEDGSEDLDDHLAEAVSELRLIKDEHEITQMRLAVDATIDGFAKVVQNLSRATARERGERVIETTFDAHARLEGNTVGYETIAASGEHATTLHWIRNDGAVRPGELVLVDAGVEVDSLYTADVTRTLPINGKFSEIQRQLYTAVLDAADAAFEAAIPGNRFRDVHAAAMEVIADRLARWGLLPGTAAESLAPSGQFHRRWMVHGTSHHLGIDVHDCAQARRELYLDGVIKPGMVFTIEPGLYFKSDDLKVPQEYRGIGIRIEDDVLITADGNENLSAALPRRPEDIEAWMAGLV